MSCNKLGVIGKISNISQPAIVKGSDAFIETQLVYKGTDNAYEIDGFDGCTGFFKQQGETTPLQVVGTLVSEDLGKLRFDMSAAETNLLASGEELSFEVGLESDSGVLFVLFESKLSVKERLF